MHNILPFSFKNSNANEAYVCHYAHNGMWRRNECQSQMIQNPIPNQVSGIRQKELFLQKDRSYPFAVVVKVQQPLDVRVALTNADGTQIYAETVFPVQPVLAKEDAQEEVDEWQRFETILTPGVDDAHAVISITYTEQAQLLIGAVSMMQGHRGKAQGNRRASAALAGWQLCRRISLAGYVPASRQARSHGGLHGK